MNIIDIDDGAKGDIVSTLTRAHLSNYFGFVQWFWFSTEIFIHSLFSGQRLFFVALIWQPN